MDIEIYQLILIAIIALGASFIQSVTGFGFGIFAMTFLPYILAYQEANVLSSILGTCTSVTVAVTLFRHIHWKNIIFPLIGSTVAAYVTVALIKDQADTTLKLMLGIVLIVLSVYFFFFSSKMHIKPSWYMGLILGTLSGITNAIFSMGGPPAVIYFMQSEKDSNDYIATLSAFFIISNINSIIAKASAGFVTVNVWIALTVGVVGMALGATIGKCVFKKLNAAMLKKAVYGVMAVSGVVNIITSLI
ncbi:MAG: sulfite exporter TauE/SafE family protein [Clostridia bacterium]|nr:sulfite exporter TauE/SafE family protein [Clostridia bacterium]